MSDESLILNSLFGTETIKSAFGQFKTAQKEFNELLQVETFSPENVDAYASALKGLTSSQQEAIITEAALGDEQKELIRTELKKTATTNAATASTEANTAANVKNSLSLRGIWTSAKAAWSSMSLLSKISIVTSIISTVVTFASKFVDSVEEVNEKANDFTKSMKELKDEAKANSGTLSSLKDEYYELSEGVSKTGQNLHLTTEEYSRYKDIVSQISDIMPDLTTMYNEQGEAIGFAEGKLADLNAEYNKYVQKEAKKMLVEGDSDGNTSEDIVDSFNYKSDLPWYEDVAAFFKPDFLSDLSDDVPVKELISELDKIKDYSKEEMWNYLNSTIEEVGDDEASNLLQGAIADALKIDASDIKYMSDTEFNDLRKNIRTTINLYKTEIDSAYDQIRDLIDTYVKSQDTYLNLSSEETTILDNMISRFTNEGIDTIGLNKSGELVETKLAEFAEDITANMSSDDKFSEAIKGLYEVDFSTADSTVKEIRQQIYDYMSYISEKLGIDIPKLYELFGFNLLGYSEDENNTIKAAANKFGISKSDLEENFTMSEIQMAYDQIDERGINTVNDLSEALKKLKIQRKKTFEDIWDEDTLKDTKDKLLELAKSGELTAEALSDDDYKDFMSDLEGIGISASEAKTEILGLLDATEKLSGVSKGISGLENAYTEFKEKNYVTAETIESIPDVFRNLETYDFDLFENIVGNPDSSVEEIQNAFNKIVTAYIKEQGTFTNLTEEDKSRFKSNLTEMGITNADEVVNSVLDIKDHLNDLAGEAERDVEKINNFLTGMGKEAVTSSNDLSECTWEEIEALMTATTYYGFSADKIKEYVAQKIWANQNKIESSADVAQLLVVAKSAGIATEAIAEYENAKKLQSQGYGGGQAWVDSMAKNAYKNVLAEIEDLYKFDMPDLSAEVDLKSKSDSDSDSTLDWVEIAVTRAEEELDRLNTAVDNTYSNWTNRSKALKEAIEDTSYAIGLQKQAYEKYLAKANSVNLPEYLKERVRLGDMSIQDHVNSDTKELIDEYSEWYNKALEAKKAQEELNQTLNELNTTKQVDMIEEYYDALNEAKENGIEKLQNKIDMAETQGFFANNSYYDGIESMLEEEIRIVSQKKANLDKVLADNASLKGTSAYTELENLVSSVSNELDELYIKIEENKNSAQENEWNYFDYLRESISRVIDEADYLIELLSGEDLFDDSGNMTKYADATLALHGSNYEVYMANAKEYAEEVKALEKDLAEGKDVIDRYNEMVDAHQDAVLAAQKEKQAILDLVSDAYQKQLDYLNEIIDKKKESLNAEKD